MKNKKSGDAKLVTQIERWLAKPGNTKAKLATALGYSSSTTIDNWISRASVPNHQQERVIAFINGGQI